MTKNSCDFIVLGGGSGGIAAARRAAQHGARVVLVESGRLGGTCVNLGCVPKKIMWHAAQLAHGFHDASGYGFELGDWRHDWARLRTAREAYIARLNGIYQANLEKDGVRMIRSPGQFVGDRSIVAGDETLTADHILIATGGQPERPDMPHAELGIDSDGFFALDRCPASVAVVGGGYIAVELAGMLQALGARVSLIVRGARLLRGFDDMLGAALLEAMRAQGVDVQLESQIESLEPVTGGARLRLQSVHPDNAQLENTQDLQVETLIWATGRGPNTAELGLESTVIATDARGFIVTDPYQNTSVGGVYAVGDVTGRAALTPVAIAAGRRLAERLFAGKPDSRLDYDLIPTVVFSHPPIGTVGMTETAACAQYGDTVKIYGSRFNALYYGVLEPKQPSHMKLVTVGPEQKIVGCHVIGQGADELLQGFAVAIQMGATKRDFDDTLAIHPTSAEELVTMR